MEHKQQYVRPEFSSPRGITPINRELALALAGWFLIGCAMAIAALLVPGLIATLFR